MPRAAKSIVIANCYPDDNRGSAALNEAACAIVRRAFPEARISLLSLAKNCLDRGGFRHSLRDYPDVELLPPLVESRGRKLHHDAVAFLNGLLMEWFPSRMPATPTGQRLRGADTVLSRGGMVLYDPIGLQKWLRRYLMLLPCRVAHGMGTPAWTLPTSVLAPESRLGHALLGRLVRSFEHVAVRDPWAVSAAAGLTRGPVEVYADTVFGLSAPEPASARPLLAKYGLEGKRFAVLTTRRLGGASPDRKKLEAQAVVASELLRRGELDRVLVVAQTVGPDLDETSTARELAERIGPPAVWLDGDFSHRDLIALYAHAEFVLSQHLHSFIFSTMAGTPVLVFSTEGAKVEGLLEGMQLPPWLVLDAGRDDAKAVAERVERLRSSRAEIGAQLAAASRRAHGEIQRFVGRLASAAARG